MAHRNVQSGTVRPYDRDQRIIDQFTSTGVNRSARKPFRPWLLFAWLSLSIIALGVVARIVGLLYGH